MNKILTDTCQCGCNPTLPENLLKITSGNDFCIKLQLTEKIDDNWVHYDMTDMSNVTVSVVSPNNTATELDYIVDVAGNIQAIVDAQKFQSYIIYGVEVLWRDETDVVHVDKRAYAPNVFAFVNSSMEATDSSYEYTSDNPYEYNITINNDVVCLSIGYIPEFDPAEYYTRDDIDSKLEDYVTEQDLSDTLENYATDQDVADAIATIDTSNYVTNSSLATTLQDYETKSELSTTLQDYVTTTSLNTTLNDYAQLSDLSDYVTSTSLNTTLNDYAQLSDLSDYVTSTSLNTTLNDYVTDTELATSLNPYATTQYVDDAIDNIDIDTSNFYTKSDIDTTLNSYATSIVISGEHIIPGPSISKVISLYNSTGTSISSIDLPAISVFNNSGTLNVRPTGVSTGLIKASDVQKIYEDGIRIDDAEADITLLDGRVTTLENNPSVPSNVVTSDDGNEIVCLTQSEYDTLEQNDQLDSDVFYYITDATSEYVTNSSLTTTLADYATKNYVDTAVSQVQPDTTNLVTINTTQTISGTKTFTATNSFTNESSFTNSNYNLSTTDIGDGIAKSALFARGMHNQAIIGQIFAPNRNATNSTTKLSNEIGVIKFQSIVSASGGQPSTLTDLAKIDSNGIYEGTTLLSDKYALKSEIPTSSGVSEEDWDNSNEAIAQELLDNRLEHISINNNFNNYYTKTEADSRYATQSWANSRFVTQTDDVNRQQAIAAAFASSVQSTSVHNIWTGSQNDYDAITTKDINTLYIIL